MCAKYWRKCECGEDVHINNKYICGGNPWNIKEERKVVKGIYKHFKGNVYEVICVAKHSETKEKLVIYKDSSNTWARPLNMFLEYLDGKPRFELVKEIKKGNIEINDII